MSPMWLWLLSARSSGIASVVLASTFEVSLIAVRLRPRFQEKKSDCLSLASPGSGRSRRCR